MTERVERMREQAADAMQRGQQAASRRMEAAQDAAARGVEAARAGAGEAADRAAAVVAKVKPRLRGVIHEYAFFAAIVLGVILVAASSAHERPATAVYALGICGLFGVSALYHRHEWGPRARTWMRRLDHSMIFIFIAATFTPFAMLVLRGTLATAILAVVWGGALAGVVLSLAWVSAPKWVSAIVYVTLGMVALVAAPQLIETLGWLPVLGLALGGALYTTGAVIYATGRPDPRPQTFGYHEVFHTLVTGAAGAHYAVIAFAVLPFAK
ncbi:MAG TPA: hemolysin III family protein [Solirubrobacteraceae bacterium]|nr:hemolysin III family protein [Solirubrobacteraceae bacterium]